MKHIPRKRFGQHFLSDDSVLFNIISAISPASDEAIVEIGPGMGAMTRLLTKAIDHLHVIELDRDLVQYLQHSFPSQKLTVHEGDALQFDFSQLLSSTDKKLRIVGNLPYNISTPLLFHLTRFVPSVKDQHFMLQKEVAERMVALPGSKSYGRLSVMLQWRYDMDYLFTVQPTAFDPPPMVDSAIIRMRPLATPLPCQPKALVTVVTKAFSQRRKVIRNCLSPLFNEAQLRACGIDPQLRPEEIFLEQYVELAKCLDQPPI